MNINDTIKDHMQMIKHHSEEAARLMQEENLFKLNLDVVSSVYVSSGTRQDITFYLNKDSDRQAQREFIFDLKRVYGVEFKKEKSYSGESLELTGKTADGRLVEVYHYVPPTCQVMEEEVNLSDWEIENATKQIEEAKILLTLGKKTVKKVVCS